MLNTKINKINLRNILTIRYDPQKSSNQYISPKNFLPRTNDPTGKKTEKLLINSIRDFFNSNTKSITISISGGIDSTLALGLIRKSLPDAKITALCGIFEDGFDESTTAKQVAKKFDANFYPIKMSSIFTSMPEIISITKKPKWNTYIHLIAKNAKKFSDNFVTGDGADEVFGGYTFRYSKFLNLLNSNDTWITKTKNYLECHNRDWVPDQNLMFGKSIKFNWNQIYDYFKSYFNNNLSPINQVMLADYNGKLVNDFIPLGNTIAKHYGLNTFSPFQNRDIISLGLKLPLSQKYDVQSKKGKLVLRKISKRLGINHIDDKRGFSPSLFFDWKKNGRKICNYYIMQKDSNVFREKLINFNWVLEAIEKIEDDGDIRYLNRIISILALEIWFRIFILKEMEPTKKLT